MDHNEQGKKCAGHQHEEIPGILPNLRDLVVGLAGHRYGAVGGAVHGNRDPDELDRRRDQPNEPGRRQIPGLAGFVGIGMFAGCQDITGRIQQGYPHMPRLLQGEGQLRQGSRRIVVTDAGGNHGDGQLPGQLDACRRFLLHGLAGVLDQKPGRHHDDADVHQHEHGHDPLSQ